MLAAHVALKAQTEAGGGGGGGKESEESEELRVSHSRLEGKTFWSKNQPAEFKLSVDNL